jgi:hypothetical protein
VICKHQFFCLNLIDEFGEELSVSELEMQFSRIRSIADKLPFLKNNVG